jgi:HEPN domain-containing protein
MKPSPAQPRSRIYWKPNFLQDRSKAVIEHFQGMVSEFQMGHWETAITKSGKFVEASLKALWAHLGNTLLKPKEFKVGSIIRQLEQCPLP